MQCWCLLNFLHTSNQILHRYGVAAGGEALASSVSSAMEGVFVRGASLIIFIILIFAKLKPIEGAESEGAFGFFKGVGKGLVGFVIDLLIE